jgi:hypothetical protein
MSVCPSVYMEAPGSQWTDFPEILYVKIFRNFVEKIQVRLKSENSRYSKRKPKYIYDSISLNSSQNEKYFRQMF